MEYLVTMTTQVPNGTSDADIETIRTREAARSQELAAEGYLLRLWRPPVQPGEWRTIGMFEAAMRAELEAVLLSMPLRVWRTDDVVTLSPHPNDPGRQAGRPGSSVPPGGSSEFLTTFTVVVPPDASSMVVETMDAREAERVRELAGQGELLRLWALPGGGRALGLWRAHDAEEMQALLKSLPLSVWSSVATMQLAPHPSDPGLTQN